MGPIKPNLFNQGETYALSSSSNLACHSNRVGPGGVQEERGGDEPSRDNTGDDRSAGPAGAGRGSSSADDPTGSRATGSRTAGRRSRFGPNSSPGSAPGGCSCS